MNTPTSVADTLRLARSLIQKPNNWTQGSAARRDRWSPGWIDPKSMDAQAWCVRGAVQRIDGPFATRALYLLATIINGDPCTWWDISEWNDAADRKHKDVLNLFDRAIAEAESTPLPTHVIAQ